MPASSPSRRATAPADWAPGDPPLLFPDEYTAPFREVRLDDAAAALHLVYLTGLILAVAWLAVRLAGGGRRHWLAAGIPMAVVAVSPSTWRPGRTS